MKIIKLLNNWQNVSNIRLFSYAIYYSLIIYLVVDCVDSSNPPSDQSHDQVFQSHHQSGHHNSHHYHNHYSHNRHKLRHKSPATSQMARNRRDFKSDLLMTRTADDSDKRADPSALLYSDPPLNKNYRKRNNSPKPPNIIFILTDDQDMELGESWVGTDGDLVFRSLVHYTYD